MAFACNKEKNIERQSVFFFNVDKRDERAMLRRFCLTPCLDEVTELPRDLDKVRQDKESFICREYVGLIPGTKSQA